MYLVEELKDKNLLKQEPTSDQMLELTELIYQYRQKHAVDFRLHKIEALEAIAEYLISQGIAVGNRALTILIIEDVWDFFPVFSRRFGYKVKAGLGYRYGHTGEQSTSDGTCGTVTYPGGVVEWFPCRSYRENTGTLTAPFLLARAEYRRPINHRRQLDLDWEARYYLDAKSKWVWNHGAYAADTDDNDGSGSLEGHWSTKEFEIEYQSFYSLDCAALARCILSSRTYLTLSGNLGYGHLDRGITALDMGLIHAEPGETPVIEDTTYAGPSFSDWYYSLGVGLTYRITIPLELTVGGFYHSGPQVVNSTGFGNIDWTLWNRSSGLWPLATTTTGNETEAARYELSVVMSYYIF
jgi:hypothetical protein